MTENTEIAVIETQSMANLLAMPEGGDEFYSEEIQAKIEEQISLTDNLVGYPLTAEGEKAMNTDATAINKAATALDKTAAAIFKRVTESANANRSTTKAQVDRLKKNRQRILDQFAEAKKARIEAIRTALNDALVSAWTERNVAIEYRNGTAPEPKESMLTEKGALTKSTKATIDGLAQADLMWQVEIESRIQSVKLACYEAGINTPFDSETVGQPLYDADRNLFQARLDRLIALDAERKEEIERKAKAKLEAEHQAELDRKAREHERSLAQARQEPKPEPVPVPEPLPPVVAPQPVQRQPEPEPVEIAFQLPKSDKMLSPGNVIITVGFKFNLKRPMTEKQLTNWLEGLAQDQIIEKFKGKMVSFEVSNELG